MNERTVGLWRRALRAVKTAEALVQEDPEAAASRAYYAVFYGASAILALEGATFKKHSAVRAAVYREWVKRGLLPVEIGADYSWLMDLRDIADYGGTDDIGPQEAAEAASRARAVLEALRGLSPEPLP